MKQKYRLSFPIIALLAIVGISLADADDAQGNGPGMMMGGGMMGRGMMGYAPQTGVYPNRDLSAGTKSKVIDERIAFIQNTAQLRTDIAVRRLELEKLLIADRRDTNAVNAKYEEMGNLQYRLQQAALASNSAINKLVPDAERGGYGWNMMGYGMGYGMMGYGAGYGMMGAYGPGQGMAGGYGPGYGMMGGYGMGYGMMGTPPGSCGPGCW
jgi:Spy/CpxP family protein refolding chaperone